MFEDGLGGNDPVGRFGDDQGLRTLDDFVGDDHVPADRQAVEEFRIVGQGHLFGGDGPAAVLAEDLPIIVIGSPVLGIDEVGPFEGFVLVMYDRDPLGELRSEVVAFGIGDGVVGTHAGADWR